MRVQDPGKECLIHPETVCGTRLAQGGNVTATLKTKASMVFPCMTSFAVTGRRVPCLSPISRSNPSLYTLVNLAFAVPGGLWLVSSFRTEERGTNNAGQTLRCHVSIFEESRTERLFSEVSRKITEARYSWP